MRTLHLFAGAGGGLLADLILSHQPIAAVEWDAYACAVLRERRDEGWFPGLQVHEGDVRLFDPSQYAGKVDCIHAGFPCQDISTAGKGAGITGARSGLVSEVFRAIDAIRPEFVFLENSPAIRTRGRHVVLGELVARGYAYRDGILAASDIGACHKRARWWCLATHADSIGDRSWGDKRGTPFRRDKEKPKSLQQENRETHPDNTKQVCKAVANPGIRRCGGSKGWEMGIKRRAEAIGASDAADRSCEGLEEWCGPQEQTGAYPTATRGDWWSTEPALGRVAHGVANRVDRIKAIGNGQVPLQAATAWRLLGGPQ